ncbi:RNI-like protein [Eremomyces bilateralis CBS 781.70]|uniref:RNI-like protein n=1 Tax=Eremomyces bilateralis CBS 781.70 TaxID=1392243 RepID=A0A6G1FSN3_9PEZI|nr:RNI-like protein [Eremomyces bilateralis CBS 781.70]KAF1808784.1 RNI-like protein [Eremomyces bilateralis CBS 781.70]
MENADDTIVIPNTEEDDSDAVPALKRRKLDKGKGKARVQSSDEDDDLPVKGKGTGKKGKGKGKAGKGKGKGKKKPRGSEDDSESEDADDFLARDMYKKGKKLPGQLENCEECRKRFTVTPYSKTGSDGGLLCAPCGKLLKGEEAKAKKKTQKPAVTGRRRRKVESEKLDGRIGVGAKSLVQLSIEKIARYAEDVEGFGDISDPLLRKLSHIFTKNRVLKPETLDLFLRNDNRKIEIHDAAYLETDNYDRVFMECPQMEDITFGNACQLKDQNLQYMLEKARHIKHLKLYAANLITTDMWNTYLTEHGPNLETLKLTWLNASFDDSTMEVLAKRCMQLTRLKLELCGKITDEGLKHLKDLPRLAHLSLHLTQPTDPEIIESIIAAHGARLQTLCLAHIPEATNSLLNTISSHCTRLSKLRLSSAENLTDEGIATMFNEWTGKNPPLSFIDMNSTRSVDYVMPEGPDEEAVGLASAGFIALMKHSGSALRKLNVSSCRHISMAAFSEVFGTGSTYPNLEDIDLSFCGEVDSYVMAGIFRSCPNLTRVIAFGCFRIEEVAVPKKAVLIGMPRAQDAIEQFGGVGMDMMGVDGGKEVTVEA